MNAVATRPDGRRFCHSVSQSVDPTIVRPTIVESGRSVGRSVTRMFVRPTRVRADTVGGRRGHGEKLLAPRECAVSRIMSSYWSM